MMHGSTNIKSSKWV